MHKRLGVSVVFILLIGLTSVALSPPVNAAFRTIVVPDDYSSLQDAVNNAVQGERIFVKNGNYDGPQNQSLVIGKQLSLVGESVEGTKINFYPAYNASFLFNTYADAVRIIADDVSILNLTFFVFTGHNPRGAPIGGDIQAQGNRIQISGNRMITGSTATGLTVKGNGCNISCNTLTGFIHLQGKENDLYKNSAYSIVLESAERNNVCQNTLACLGLSSSNYNTITENNIDTGAIIDWAVNVNNSLGNTFEGNKIDVGVYGNSVKLSAAKNNTFYHNTFLGEGAPVILGASVEDTAWDNGKEGNYWANYNGTDFNGDGIGDTPYVIDANNIDNYPLMQPWTGSIPPAAPKLGLFEILLIAVVCVLVAVAVFLLYVRRRGVSKHTAK